MKAKRPFTSALLLWQLLASPHARSEQFSI
jgi:hypothetical protein